jgi:dTDP-4-dehydrorhamnose 3,5-epimerase
MDGVTVTKLKRIEHAKGDLLHALKSSEDSFSMFGEAYFTSILKGDVKGWKKHKVMRLNLIVPVGSVSFFVHDVDTCLTKEYTINANNYVRLTVEPGLWVAFRGNENALNLVLNIASLEHDPIEAINASIDTYPLVTP